MAEPVLAIKKTKTIQARQVETEKKNSSCVVDQ